MGLTEPKGQRDPAGHLRQEGKAPAEERFQSSSVFVTGEYEPAAHGDGVTVATPQKEPAGQGVHWLMWSRLVAAVKVPAGQGNSLALVVLVGQ